jgi:RNA polymerase sigma factor (sigma-70 family)
MSATDTWIAALRQGDVETAWGTFLERYRRLIFATIRHFGREDDEVMDAFVRVCDVLRANDMARLRRFIDQPTQRARFSTWLVTVVRNLAIDHLRERIGRPRRAIPAGLSPLQRLIYQRVFLERRSHVEAYELIRSGSGADLAFGAFLKEVSATYRSVGGRGVQSAVNEPAALAPVPEEDVPDPASPGEDLGSAVDTAERLTSALESLTPDERHAVQLFVVDEMSAADVARTVGWPNAKAVYNRVYRCLAAIRQAFERAGIQRRDL